MKLAEPSASVVTSGCELFDQRMAASAMSRPAIGGDEPFVLFVSTIEGRKNHVLAYRTWEKLVEAGEDPPRLICVGRPGWQAEEFVSLQTASAGLGGRIEVLSDVSDGELEWLYANCLFTIYPSLYEGWGLPITESLVRGKLCVASNTSSMPEAGGDLALYVDPLDPDDFGRTIRRLLANPEMVREREEAIRVGFVPRLWDDVTADYAAAAARLEPRGPASRYVSMRPGREYAVRSLGDEFVEGAAQKKVASRGPILDRPLSVEQVCEGLFVRGDGRWLNAEPWGAWLGLGGGSLDVWWPGGKTEVVVCILADVLPAFAGRILRVSLNGCSTSRPAPAPGGKRSLWVFEAPVREGVNRLLVDLDLSPADQALSRQADSRGPMWGVASVLFLDPDDHASLAELRARFAEEHSVSL
jgi:hypothetical protein